MSRYLSLLLVVAYVIRAGISGGPLDAVKVLLGCVLLLACIWFPEDVGEFIGGRITSPSPPSYVWFFGWLILLLPLVIGIFLWLQGIPIEDIL